MSKNYLFSGCVCCYTSCDFENLKIGCAEAGECLCFKTAYCLAVGAEPFNIAFCKNEDKECLSAELFCCKCAVKQPEVLCAAAAQCLCLKEAAAFPFNPDYVKEPVCAVCCLSLLPEVGVMKDAPKSPAIDRF